MNIIVVHSIPDKRNCPTNTNDFLYDYLLKISASGFDVLIVKTTEFRVLFPDLFTNKTIVRPRRK